MKIRHPLEFIPNQSRKVFFFSLLAARRHEGPIKTLGAVAGYASFVALVFDAIENYSLLRVLLGEVQSVYPALAAFCAIVKFGLIAFSLFYILTAWLLPRK